MFNLFRSAQLIKDAPPRYDSVGAYPNNPYDSFGAATAAALLRQAMTGAMPLAPTGAPAPMAGCGTGRTAQALDALRGDDIYYGVDTGATNVNAGATATITVSPQVRHIPRRLVLSANVANNFVINDIRVGVNPVFATTGAISAAIFIQDSSAPDFRATVCDVGQDFSVQVTNITGAAQRFTATVLGRYLPYCDPCRN